MTRTARGGPSRGGPLAGVMIVEMAGIGPAPFAAMMLADHGARVIRVERPVGQADDPAARASDVLLRSRDTIVVDLKMPEGVALVQELVERADGFIEGFRPGVMERLGLGPAALLARNPQLVYGRMTGWGQDGPYAPFAGHDINYIALAGALHGFGRAGEQPTPPINMVGDFGGGGMLLAFGLVSAILSARAGGVGQVVDAAMVDGAAVLMSMIWGFRAQGSWQDERGVNLLDSGAHFYDTYRCSDGHYVALGAIEPQFYATLRAKLGIEGDADFDRQMDPAAWPDLKARLAALFETRTRADWCAILEHCDACFAPVLAMSDAPDHPHNAARRTFLEVGGVVQPAPAPRFSATPSSTPTAACAPASVRVLSEVGIAQIEIDRLVATGAIR